MFKVVTDQLKVSQGWVRCGQCTEVFNASVHLQPHPSVVSASQQDALALPTEEVFPEPSGSAHEACIPTSVAAPNFEAESTGAGMNAAHPLPANTHEEEHGASVNRSDSLPEEFEADASSENHFDDAPALQTAQMGTFEVSSPPVATLSPSELAPEAVALVAEVPVAVIKHDAFLPVADVADVADEPDALDASDASGERAAADVSFVREAKRRAFWRQPVVRLVLGVFVVAFAALLLLQTVVQHKDSLLAHEPRLKPLLLVMCQQLQCELAPLRQIDAMVIDSSSFTKLDSDSFRLSFTLKNTASGAVALPALEVTLTDMRDQAMIRRVLLPSQFGAAEDAVLGAGQEFSGQVSLQVSGASGPGTDVSSTQATSNGAQMRVAGYRLLAFYP